MAQHAIAKHGRACKCRQLTICMFVGGQGVGCCCLAQRSRPQQAREPCFALRIADVGRFVRGSAGALEGGMVPPSCGQG